MHRPVISSDGRQVGVLRAIAGDFLIVRAGFVSLRKYIIPKPDALSVDSKMRILLKTSTSAIRTKNSHRYLQDSYASDPKLPDAHIRHDPRRDRAQLARLWLTRNRIAGLVAMVSGILFLISGYKANIATYEMIEQQLASIESIRAFWDVIIIPLGVLAILSQLSGISVLAGSGFFMANRVNAGKFLVMVGTGQGLITIAWRIVSEVIAGNFTAANSFVLWLTSTAAGLGIIFAILSQSLSKGKGESIYMKAFRFVFRIKRKGS